MVLKCFLVLGLCLCACLTGCGTDRPLDPEDESQDSEQVTEEVGGVQLNNNRVFLPPGGLVNPLRDLDQEPDVENPIADATDLDGVNVLDPEEEEMLEPDLIIDDQTQNPDSAADGEQEPDGVDDSRNEDLHDETPQQTPEGGERVVDPNTAVRDNQGDDEGEDAPEAEDDPDDGVVGWGPDDEVE